MRRNSGFILVSVMLAAATLLTSATAFAWFARTQARAEAVRERIYRFRNIAEIAADIVIRRIAEDSNGYDGPTEKLYSPYEHIELEIGGCTAEVQVRPLNDKLPLRGLLLPDGVTVKSEYEDAWENIWEKLELPELAWTVVDFFDEDTEQRLGGSERDENINRMVSDLSELRAMPEITDEVLWGTEEVPGLSAYVTVVESENININAAQPEVLTILDDSLTDAHARSIAAYRLVNPIRDMDDLRSIPGFPRNITTKLANIIGFESTHFLLSIKVTDEAGSVRNYRAVVKRGDSEIYIWQE